MLTEASIKQQLQNFVDPYLEQDWVTADCVKALTIQGDAATIQITLGYPAASSVQALSTAASQVLASVQGLASATFQLDWTIKTHAVQQGMRSLEGVKNIIAVASGKGGVGKSTTATNVALALQAEGAKVGILDADIYGPSVPLMLGVDAQQPAIHDKQSMEPVISHGLQSMSIGYLIDTTTPMVWRGPMVSTALQQLLYQTHWQDLDYLIVDLPPGTGDIQLTLAQKIPVSGAMIVTTPQDLALLDVRKAIGMFRKVKVPVLGVVENMSTHVCSQCGHEEAIFGSGGGAKIAQEFQVPFLGQLPLTMAIREHVDSGSPTLVVEPAGQLAHRYREIAKKLSARLSLQTKSYAHIFPKITIE